MPLQHTIRRSMASSTRLFFQKHPVLVNTALAVFSLLITSLLLEFSFRWCLWLIKPRLYSELIAYQQIARSDHSALRFQPHPYTSFTRADTRFDKQGIHIGENKFTFQKPNNTIRIASLGGSTTMNQHPIHLKRFLEYDFGNTNYESMDFGCDSWTSQESLINYLVRVKSFSPDVILLHHSVNDVPPRLWGEFKPDYTNFRTTWHNQTGWLLQGLSRYNLLVNGILFFKGNLPFADQNYIIRPLPPYEKRKQAAPQSIQTFKRNIDTLVSLAQASGTRVILAPVNYHPEQINKMEAGIMDEHRQFLLQYAAKNNLACVDTKWILMENRDWFLDSVHLNPPGIFMNTQLFTAAVRDLLRGYSDVVLIDGSIQQKRIQLYNERWIPKRRIQLTWAMDSAKPSEYHIYVKEVDSNEPRFLANVRNTKHQTVDWYQNNPTISSDFQTGPKLGTDYRFQVFAIGGEQPYPTVGPTIEKGVFEIHDRIVFQEAPSLD